MRCVQRFLSFLGEAVNVHKFQVSLYQRGETGTPGLDRRGRGAGRSLPRVLYREYPQREHAGGLCAGSRRFPALVASVPTVEPNVCRIF